MLEWDRSKESSRIILDNKLGITDWDLLEEAERRISKFGLEELFIKEKDEKLVFDKEYLLSIHKSIFQDVYPWAGTIREVELYKGNSAFAPARFLNNSLDELSNNLKKDNFLEGFSREEVAELTSYYMLELNFIHPFREGNGRTKRHFMTQLLDRAGFDLSLESIEPKQLVLADIIAFDDNEAGLKANPSYLKYLLFNSIKDNRADKRKTTYSSKLDELNRFLWVYDRYDSRAYFSRRTSLKDAEDRLEKMLDNDAGKEQIKQVLDRIISKERNYYDGTAEYRKDIVEKAILYKQQIDENKILKKEIEMKKTNENEMTLAEKLDNFYSDYDPYGRYDGTGSFSPEYDDEQVGLKQTQEALATEKGRKSIDEFLKECIKNDERPEIVKRAKQLRIELLDPKNRQENINVYLNKTTKEPKKEKVQTRDQKKQKGIK